jgi:hypothetical protein
MDSGPTLRVSRNDKEARVIARILCGAGYAVTLAPFFGALPSPLEPKPEGMERRAAQPLAFRLAAAAPCEGASPLGAPCAAFLSPGPRFLVYAPVSVWSSKRRLNSRHAFRAARNHWPIPSPASSSRSARSGARSGPEASRVRGYEPRPQAPQPLPPSLASHENALGWRGCENIGLHKDLSQ